jgi:hypothetical protein
MKAQVAYQYVKEFYGVNPEVGMRVTFNEKGCARKEGVIVSRQAYNQSVYVRFDGARFDVPCHPLSLEYHKRRKGW